MNPDNPKNHPRGTETMQKNRTLEEVIAAQQPRVLDSSTGRRNNPKSIQWRMFFESRKPHPTDNGMVVCRTFAYQVPALAVLVGDFAMATPASRYLDKPRLAAKRRRDIERALRRGRRTQIAAKLNAYAGR